MIPNRVHLDNKFAEVMKNMHNLPVKRPANWGGYLVKPNLIEFWQGRAHRLHDRIQFRLIDRQQWLMERLAP